MHLFRRSAPWGEAVRRIIGTAVVAGTATIWVGLDTTLLARLSSFSTNGFEQRLLAVFGRDADVRPGSRKALLRSTEWLNTQPLGPEDLEGKVVLVNFWTYACINCVRALPHVRDWAEKYGHRGLVVIGVHTPEFAFEKDAANVRRAVRSLDVTYPVVLDNDYAIWSAFDNHYWPALYFLDREGVIRDQHFGEGRYEESERVLQRLLGSEREPVPVEGLGVEAEADWGNLQTPETYLGYGRGEGFASPDGAVPNEAHAYEVPEHLRLSQWALAGEWTIGSENVAAGQAGASISFRFHARDAHLVLSPGAHGQIPFRVLVDGEPPGPAHGVDVDEDGNGVLRDGRLYQLVRQHDGIRERTLEITLLEPGAEAYVFTFG
jgi:thiol-disulfide isomerase/thioredoxin